MTPLAIIKSTLFSGLWHISYSPYVHTPPPEPTFITMLAEFIHTHQHLINIQEIQEVSKFGSWLALASNPTHNNLEKSFIMIMKTAVY